MSRRLPDGSKERVGGGSVRAVCVEPFADRCMTLQLEKDALERFHRKGEDHFGLFLFWTQGSVSGATSPARSSGGVPDAVVGDDVVGAVRDVGYDRDLEGAVGVDKVDEGAVKRRLQQLQESCLAKK